MEHKQMEVETLYIENVVLYERMKTIVFKIVQDELAKGGDEQ